MQTTLKNALRQSGLYPFAKEVYRRTVKRDYLRSREQLMDFYGRLVGRDALVFDVGANRGDFADAFLRLGARVCAVEPHPVCTAELRALYARNERFVLIDTALGRAPGEAKLFLGENGMDNVSTLSEDYKRDAAKLPGLAVAGWNQSVTVRVRTLDDLIATHGVPDFCKIDVEGYEGEVLGGLTRPLPLLQFEYQPWSVEKAADCIDYLTGLADHEFNITMAASRDDKVALQDRWSSAADIKALLRDKIAREQLAGDVFARARHLVEVRPRQRT